MHIHNENIENLCLKLKAIADALINNPPERIGYRERVMIERPLFLTLKEICDRYLGYDLHGLSEPHRREIEAAIQETKSGREFQSLLRDIFEIRTFLLDLSSANPYVQNDALSRASVSKQNAPRTLGRALLRLAKQVEVQVVHHH